MGVRDLSALRNWTEHLHVMRTNQKEIVDKPDYNNSDGFISMIQYDERIGRENVYCSDGFGPEIVWPR